jgi:hypothetical protein
MDWAAIIAAILKIVQDCRNREGREKTFNNLRKGGLRTRFAARRVLMDQGLKGRELHEAVDRVMNDIDNASDEELYSVIDQASN